MSLPIRAALSVNKDLLQTYWDIGTTITRQENKEGCGTRIVDSLSKDLRIEFPDMKGNKGKNKQFIERREKNGYCRFQWQSNTTLLM